MDDFKLYIIRIIIILSIVQLGIIISGEKYKKLYSLAGAVFIVFAILSFPKTDFFELFNISYPTQAEIGIGEENISTAFTESVSDKIEDGIKENYNIKANVTVTTDEKFSKLYITVDCDCSEDICVKINDYVKKTFCTQNDEVITANEYIA